MDRYELVEIIDNTKSLIALRKCEADVDSMARFAAKREHQIVVLRSEIETQRIKHISARGGGVERAICALERAETALVNFDNRHDIERLKKLVSQLQGGLHDTL